MATGNGSPASVHGDTITRRQISALFTRLAADTLEVLALERPSFRRAAGFADQPALNLRAGDALHLAICAVTGAKLCTLDRRLSEAAPVVGVETLLRWRAVSGLRAPNAVVGISSGFCGHPSARSGLCGAYVGLHRNDSARLLNLVFANGD